MDLSLRVRTKFVIGLVKRDEDSACVSNVSINTVGCLHRSILRQNISSPDWIGVLQVHLQTCRDNKWTVRIGNEVICYA